MDPKIRSAFSRAVPVALVAALAWLAGSCTETLVEPVDVALVQVEPDTVRLTAGDTVRLSAIIRDESGNRLTGRRVTWSSSDSEVVTIDQSGLASALGRGRAEVTAGFGGLEGSATIEVDAAPVIVLDQTSTTFSATAGQAATPSSRAIQVTNGGDAPLTGLTASVSYGSGASGWLEATLSGATAPATLTLRAQTGSLGPGTHTATVSVASPIAANSPRTVNVTFQVGQPPPDPDPDPEPRIALNPSSIGFGATAGGSDPGASTVAVTNAGDGDLTGLAVSVSYGSGASGWLETSLNRTTAPATLTIRARTGSLAAGTYTADVRVASAVAVNSPQSVAVVFNVAEPAAQPTIGLSPTTVQFTATAGGSDPSSSSVSVSNTGTGSITNLSVSVSYGSGASGWLEASLSGTTAPTMLTLQPRTGSLSPGTYNATVSVASAVAVNSPQQVQVTFTVQADPRIGLSLTTVSFAATAGGSDPAATNVSVTNTGTGSLTGLAATVSYGSGASGWLDASLDGTTAPTTLRLRARTGSLSPGTYNATVSVTSPVASNSPRTISVTFNVNAPDPVPSIGLSPTSLSFSATAGGSDPAAATVAVTNTGTGSVTGISASVSYGSGASGWLETSFSGSTAPTTLTVQARTGSLNPGTHTANVLVSSPVAVNSPQTVSVTFTISAPDPEPSIGLTPTSLSFSATAGGSNPASSTVSITNTGTGSLTGLSVSVSYGSGASGWLQTQLSGTTAPATLTVQPVTGSLSPGSYTATLSVSSAVAVNSPQTVTVEFEVGAPEPDPEPRIALDPTSTSFTATAGGSNPASSTVSITNSGTGSLTGLSVSVSYGSGASGWLQTQLSGTTAPATLSLQPVTGSLAAGTYTATVSVASPVASNSPQTVSVTFTVGEPDPDPQPLIGLSPTSVGFQAVVGEADPSPENVAVTNTGSGELTGLSASVSSGASGWLEATLSGTTAPATLTIQASTGGLAVGTHTGTVTVSSPVAGNSPQTVAVTFQVLPDPNQPPAVPQNLRIANVSAAFIRLAWDHDGTNVAVYRLERRESGSATWQEVAQIAPPAETYEDRSVARRTTYVYRMRACTTTGVCSDYSNEATGTSN